MLVRAGIADDFIVDVKDHPLLPGEHAVEQWRRLAQIMPGSMKAQSDGSGEPALGCYLWVSEQQRADLDAWLQTRGVGPEAVIAIQVGNKRTMRRGLRRLAANSKFWPNERWAEVIRHVRSHAPRHRIVLLGTGPEHKVNREVAALAGVEGLYNVADDLPIPRLVALLARADALITVDSGPAHAAAAVGCPQVVLFGKALPSLYRPWGTAGAEVKVLCGRIDGEPDMLGISVSEVIGAWDALKLRTPRAAA
jgi:heptosyltransferase-2/heptosyltransferase-3